MRNLSLRRTPTDQERAASLDQLGTLLQRSMPDVRMWWNPTPCGRLCLRLDVPDVGHVNVFVGNGWYWLMDPRRPLCPVSQPTRAAQLIIGAVRRAAAREREARSRGSLMDRYRSRAAARKERARTRERAAYARASHGAWAVAS